VDPARQRQCCRWEGMISLARCFRSGLLPPASLPRSLFPTRRPPPLRHSHFTGSPCRNTCPASHAAFAASARDWQHCHITLSIFVLMKTYTKTFIKIMSWGTGDGRMDARVDGWAGRRMGG